MVDLRFVTAVRDDAAPVRDITLHVERGTFCAVLGPGGSGKSTLLHLLSGDVRPLYGTVRLDGNDPSHLDPAERERRVVLLDEPVDRRDAKHQYERLRDIHRSTASGATVIAVLRDLDAAAFYADHVLLMRYGRIVAYGVPNVVLQPLLLAHVFGFRCATRLTSAERHRLRRRR